VYLDGNKLLNQLCEIEDWHTGYYYYHYLTGYTQFKSRTDNGCVAEKEITFKKDNPLWILTSYWEHDNDGIIIDVLNKRFRWA
jgi:hypothetical protein